MFNQIYLFSTNLNINFYNNFHSNFQFSHSSKLKVLELNSKIYAYCPTIIITATQSILFYKPSETVTTLAAGTYPVTATSITTTTNNYSSMSVWSIGSFSSTTLLRSSTFFKTFSWSCLITPRTPNFKSFQCRYCIFRLFLISSVRFSCFHCPSHLSKPTNCNKMVLLILSFHSEL